MRILMVLYLRFPPDIRVEKEAKSLIKEGHDIYLIALSNTKKEYFEKINNINVIYLKRYLLDRIMYRFNYINYVLVKKICEVIKKYQIEIIHVHDLPLVKTGVVAAKIHKIPIIADLHENYPAYLALTKKRGIKKLIFNLFFNQKRYRAYELSILKQVNKIILVTQEGLERFRSKISLDKFKIISNVVDKDRFPDLGLDKILQEKYENKFIVSYIGTVARHRGLDTTINALKFLKNKNIRLLIVGATEEKKQNLINLAKRQGVNNLMDIIGWVSFNEMIQYVKVSDVGLIPHNATEHTNTTIPHKLFHYLYLKRPVLVSDCKPLKRIVEDTKSGLIFKANDSKHMAKKLSELYELSKNNKLKEYGINGYNAVIHKYNWENESKKLILLYKEFNKE
ncbi:MAG: glycosyltransferase family 4 protein [Promethearchaeota archaeon]